MAMHGIDTFWRKLLLWTSATVVVLGVFNIVQFVVAPPSLMDPGRYALGVIEHLPVSFAMLLPLTAYAAGVAASERKTISIRTAFLCGAGVGLLVFLLVGFVGPWLERAMTYDSARALRHYDSGQLDLFTWGARYDRLVAELRSVGASAYDARHWMEANRAGWRYHAVFAMSAMPVLTAALGFVVGDRVSRAARGRWMLIETWVVGLVLFVVISAFVVLGREASEQRNVSPMLTAWLPLFGPGVALVTLWWSRRHDAARETSAPSPAEQGANR